MNTLKRFKGVLILVVIALVGVVIWNITGSLVRNSYASRDVVIENKVEELEKEGNEPTEEFTAATTEAEVVEQEWLMQIEEVEKSPGLYDDEEAMQRVINGEAP